MSRDEQWLRHVLEHGVEARLDSADSEDRVTVSLGSNGQVQWAPLGETPERTSTRHHFCFWVHTNTDSERLDAIQILGARLVADGHSFEIIPVAPGAQP